MSAGPGPVDPECFGPDRSLVHPRRIRIAGCQFPIRESHSANCGVLAETGLMLLRFPAPSSSDQVQAATSALRYLSAVIPAQIAWAPVHLPQAIKYGATN